MYLYRCPLCTSKGGLGENGVGLGWNGPKNGPSLGSVRVFSYTILRTSSPYSLQLRSSQSTTPCALPTKDPKLPFSLIFLSHLSPPDQNLALSDTLSRGMKADEALKSPHALCRTVQATSYPETTPGSSSIDYYYTWMPVYYTSPCVSQAPIVEVQVLRSADPRKDIGPGHAWRYSVVYSELVSPDLVTEYLKSRSIVVLYMCHPRAHPYHLDRLTTASGPSSPIKPSRPSSPLVSIETKPQKQCTSADLPR
jgi:hypothetical protein